MNDSATFELSVTPNVGMLWVFITRSTPTCIHESIQFVQARRHGGFKGVHSNFPFGFQKILYTAWLYIFKCPTVCK